MTANFFHYVSNLNKIGVRLNTELDTVRDEFAIDQACEHMRQVRDMVDELEYVLKQFKDARERLKTEIMPAKFDEAGVSSITVNGHRFTKSERLRVSMSDKDNGMQWLRDHDLGDLIKETVNAQTLAATARSLLEEGRELPEDYFKTFIFANTSITKAK